MLGVVMPLSFRRPSPSPVLLVLYACSTLGLGLGLVGVVVSGAIRFWWAGLVIVGISGIALSLVRWRSRRSG